MNWTEYQNGETVGLIGSESGRIAVDQEHSSGARITLEKDAELAPFTITCGIYGWMVHTRFFSSRTEAQEQFEAMKHALGEILAGLPGSDSELDGEMAEFLESIEAFTETYP